MTCNRWMNQMKHLAMALLFGAGLNMMLASVSSAGTSGPWTRSSTVVDAVTNNNNGTWNYGYTVNNTSQIDVLGTDPQPPILVDWELPWFDDAGITDILSPLFWTHSIETIGVANLATGWEGVAAWQNSSDPFYAGASSPFSTVTKVLHWYNTCWSNNVPASFQDVAFVQTVAQCAGAFDNAVFDGGSLSGFSFTAAFDKTAAPYQASWAFLPVRTGDPAFPLGGIPASPQALGQAVPEPGALALMGVAMIALVWSRRRRQA